MVRTYIQNPQRSYQGKRARLRTQTSSEWDISLNLDKDNYNNNANIIVSYAKAQCEKIDSPIKYMFISGIEHTIQKGKENNSTYDNYHIHICLVLKKPVNRCTALSAVRPIKVGNKEYCTIRNRKFSYFGWRVHHNKINTKIDPSKRMLYEYGVCPPDKWSSELIERTNKVLLQFGCDNDKKAWTELRTELRSNMKDVKAIEIAHFKKLEQAREKYEQCLMTMEDLWLHQRDNKNIKRMKDTEMEDEDVRRKRERRAFFIRKNARSKKLRKLRE